MVYKRKTVYCDHNSQQNLREKKEEVVIHRATLKILATLKELVP